MSTKGFTAEELAVMLHMPQHQFDFEQAIGKIPRPDAYVNGVAKWSGATAGALRRERLGPAKGLDGMISLLEDMNRATKDTP